MSNIIKIDNSDLQLENITVSEFRELMNIPENEGKFLNRKKPREVIVQNLADRKIPLFYSMVPSHMVNEPKDPEYWILSEGHEFTEEVFNYTREETLIICGVVEALSNSMVNSSFSKQSGWYKVLEVLEKLCRATKLRHIVQGFYKTIGWRQRFLELVTPMDLVLMGDSKSWSTDVVNPNRYIYQPNKNYDLLDLVDDLLADNAMINLDPDRNFPDEYINMSSFYGSESKPTQSKVQVIPDQWCKVVGKVGNSQRANISLSYVTDVEIEVPSNNFGVESPLQAKTIRNVCMVKDGFPWKKLLPVKISENLKAKLEKEMLVIENEIEGYYVLNLTTIPVVKKLRVDGFRKETLGLNHLTQITADAKIYYVRHFFPEKKTEPVTPAKGSKEEFLASLGVSEDGFYTPLSTAFGGNSDQQRHIDQVNSIQFSGQFLENVQKSSPTNTKLLGIRAAEEYEAQKKFISPVYERLFSVIQDRLSNGEDPEEIVKELKEESTKCKRARMNLKVTLYNLIGSAEFKGTNFSAVTGLNYMKKDTNDVMGIRLKVNFGRTEIPYTSYNW